MKHRALYSAAELIQDPELIQLNEAGLSPPINRKATFLVSLLENSSFTKYFYKI